MKIRFLIIVALTLFTLAPSALAETGTATQQPPAQSGLDTGDTTKDFFGGEGANTRTTNTSNDITLINPLGSGNCSQNGGCLMDFLNDILVFVIRIGTVVVVVMLIYVGYLFVVAQGSSDKITEARQALLWTVVGALILLGAQAISLGIQATVAAISTG